MPLIKIESITADQRAQPRSSILVDKVNEYTEDMERGDKFPALVLFREGDRYYLGDGFHRYYAAIAAGQTSIECHVKDGTLRDAILFSCGANAAHGLRRTNADKRCAAAKLLEDSEWSQWADAEIARHCCVTQQFVGKIRKEVQTFSPTTVVGDERKYRTKHGAEATMKPGEREVPRIPEGALIAKWLQEIDRLIAKMPTAPAAVGHFPVDQHYLFPLSRIEEMAAWFADFVDAWRAKMVGMVHERTR